MNTLRTSMSRYLHFLAACSFLAFIAAPGPVLAQEFPRDELDEALDQLATDRAQDLNQAYYAYESDLEDLRQEAERQDRPELYTERREELRTALEDRVLRIERGYEQRRADVLLAQTGRGDQARPLAAEERFDRPTADRNRADHRIAQLNDELAQAWAEFNRRADEARERVRTDDAWDGYEATITQLEDEYQQRIADIQSRQRSLRFEMERERRQ